MMSDYRERAYISRMRIIHREHFPCRRSNQRYSQIFVDNPDYLAREVRCVLLEKDIVSTSLSEDEMKLLTSYMAGKGNPISVGDVDLGAEFYSHIKLNGVKISTVHHEERKGTCDSVVFGRYLITDHGGLREDVEELCIGEVQHVMVIGSHQLLCVEWFNITRVITDDQRAGLEVIPVSIKREQDQMWIDVGSIVIQQHVLIRPDKRAGSFHAIIKI